MKTLKEIIKELPQMSVIEYMDRGCPPGLYFLFNKTFRSLPYSGVAENGQWLTNEEVISKYYEYKVKEFNENIIDEL